ncbi:hypothetical protein GRI34_06910 [Erythrobacter aquimaris]|uniref:DUF2157 domain-containing protein n=1 Tax=Qipengyuania aquimaris TaxID=255984 RepID=A0A6I4TM41_9SPHN|nr:hypothetical protein [Qipengyuania aquimaris]MXO96147.1 hypothetical protein [Qipengyuania aquimaris]
MYSQEDLNSAVASGAISQEAVDALRAHVASTRDAVPADAEHFRLITGFNDIFVTIGVIIMLVAMGAIGQAIAGAIWPVPAWPEMGSDPDWWENNRSAMAIARGMGLSFAALGVAVTAWLLAEFFTLKRRMALPSIILLLAFVGGVFLSQLGGIMAYMESGTERSETIGFLWASLALLITAGFAWMHWKRFMVPITIAAGTAAIAGTAIALIIAIIGPDTANIENVLLSLVFVAGLVVFGFAMRWDISDPKRETRRSDVAFWLHLLAAPMIAHPVFALIGVTDGDNIGALAAVLVLAVYIVFGLVALAIDRRALLVSALAYVLIALTFLFREFGAVELNFALTALVIGSALLTLSALWTPIRRAVVQGLPSDLKTKLPATA